MIESIKQIVVQAGELIRRAHITAEDISNKGGCANFVTKYDVMVQDYLFEHLSQFLPDATFLGEESTQDVLVSKGYTFIIDPIDGTSNFIAGHGCSCISVALAFDGIVQIGTIYNPFRDELYYAERGKGAYLNATPLHMPDRPLTSGLVCFDTSPYHPAFCDATFLLAREIISMGADLRRLGSGALELCYVAANRFSLTYALRQSPWDYAAGWLIVEEAGGLVTTLDGTSPSLNEPSSIVAGCPASHAEFLKLAAEMRDTHHLSW